MSDHHGVAARLRHFLIPHSHDVADSIDDALAASTEGIRAVRTSLIILGVTALAQLAVVAVSGSVALLADTIHNFSDALTAIPLWIAFALSRRAPSARYSHGYGRAEDLAGAFIVAMIALSAVVAGVESIRRLTQPQPLEHLGWVLAAGVIGFAGNELVALYRIRVGRRIGSAALVADGMHARTDGFTSLAVVLGVIGVWAGFPLADPIIGLVITAAILVLLWSTARDVGRRLLDGVDPGLYERALATLGTDPTIAGVGRLRLRWTGHRLAVQAQLRLPAETTVATSDDVTSRAEEALRQALPGVGAVDLTVTASPSTDGGSHAAAASSSSSRP
ncbi:cation transporter [Ruania alkalisoli]|uniref:Cation transporter n=1 Tax=Ruania alkalisoli TaxID=2779775 RepID=A0A7M1SV08_9MICO|nr:cation diffusion facilitator family transporter [Ruania alkalisoli]QOR71409.1 cation transporter [Ruania alkalisoli]